MSEIRAADFPGFQSWANAFVPPITPSGYLENKTSLLSALLVVELTFPRLVEIRDCVLLADRHDPSTFERWWDALGGDQEQVERVVNAQPMRALFEPADEVEDAALRVLAERIARGWRSAAALRFPDRAIVVEVVEGGDDDGPTVLLYVRWSGLPAGASRGTGRDRGSRSSDVRAEDFPAFRSWSSGFQPGCRRWRTCSWRPRCCRRYWCPSCFPRLHRDPGMCGAGRQVPGGQLRRGWWKYLSGDRERVERMVNFQAEPVQLRPRGRGGGRGAGRVGRPDGPGVADRGGATVCGPDDRGGGRRGERGRGPDRAPVHPPTGNTRGVRPTCSPSRTWAWAARRIRVLMRSPAGSSELHQRRREAACAA